MVEITVTEVNAASVEGFCAELAELELDGPVMVDFSEVRFIDWRGIWALACAAREAANQGRSFTVVNADENIQRVFEINGLDDLLDLRDTSEPAATTAGRLSPLPRPLMCKSPSETPATADWVTPFRRQLLEQDVA